MKILKFFGFVCLVIIGLALILSLAGLGVAASPMIALSYGVKQYFDFRTERERMRMKVKYRLEKCL